ncbi:uncharacterized protein LOC143274616 [Babylonia areolata]|uniref:uncharacterized protein LOC143274616 n=1 Tax=Babylonia areolata TaxID=304850 RepID=UPI003FD117A0
MARVALLSQGARSAQVPAAVLPPAAKLPIFREGEDVDAFIEHFESVARDYGLEDSAKKVHMSASLSGKAREAYNTLPPEGTYADLCRALRAQYRLTPEAYRRKFRDIRKRPDETWAQCSVRLDKALTNWEQLSSIPLREFILLEQVYSFMPQDIAVQVRDSHPDDLMAAARRADGYEEARRDAREGTGLRSVGQGRHPRMPDRGTLPHRSGEKSPSSAQPHPPVSCWNCGMRGHLRRDCPALTSAQPGRYQKGNLVQVVDHADCFQSVTGEREDYLAIFLSIVEGKVRDTIRDTGATCVFVDESLVSPSAKRGKSCWVTGVQGCFQAERPCVQICVDTPYFEGVVWAVALERPPCSLLIGNTITFVDGRKERVSTQLPPGVTAGVVTRSASQPRRALEPVRTPVSPSDSALKVDRQTVQSLQRKDPSLAKVQELARTGSESPRDGTQYVFKQGTLFRVFAKQGRSFKQLVVPSELRPTVLALGHDSSMAGHLGVRRTQERIWQDFYWPGCSSDIRQYCRSCEVCQRTTPKGQNVRVPLGTVPIVGEPFSKVAVDLVGPIHPSSARGHHYILVMVDYATRYPEAVPLRSIDTPTVAEALWQMWTRVGVPDQVLSDQGTQFMGNVMREVHQLLGIKGLFTSPYHAQANGLVERFNATLKKMLQRLCVKRPRDWDRLVPAVLFAYREVPQESMKFSPFELLYGRTVKGPMSILRRVWTQEDFQGDDPARTESEYVVDLRNRVKERSKERWFDQGDEVLLLLLVRHNKLQVSWQGPFKVLERVGDWDYRISVRGKSKLYHANLLKKFLRRERAAAAYCPTVIEDKSEATELGGGSSAIPCVPLTAEESFKDVVLGADLAVRRAQLQELTAEASYVHTDLPLRSRVGECELILDTDEPVWVRQYPLPHSQTQVIAKEVEAMLSMGVIEKASSPYSAPIVLVRKKDGKVRFCVDYRQLNKHLRFDAEPLPNIDEIFARLGKAKVFSKLDLTKGYWQIPVKTSDRPKTAFTTPDGQFQWVTMPFGLKTAGAIFSRTMREVLAPLKLPEIQNFMDDLLIASECWRGHIKVLRALFRHLKEVHLAAKPSKCELGFSEIQFLGHTVSEGHLGLQQEKVDRIRNAPVPTTKKELRSFLGLAGYYRKFVPRYAEVALPLTEKTRGKEPTKVSWSPECQKAFDSLKDALVSAPILQLPDQSKPFVLRTDASGTGLGAVLLQEHEGMLRPVAYASKKLVGAEFRYHAIELECLAVVWSVRKFYPYLHGRTFQLQCDHNPLQYLHRIRPVSRRLMGWAMELQSHSCLSVSEGYRQPWS